MEGTVLLIAPFQSLLIQIGHIPEGSARQKIALHEAHQPFHLPLGVGVPGLAELRLEAERVHERLVLPVPHGLAAHVAVVYNALHVVREDVFRDSHVLESVDHANEQVLLLGVGEEFNEHVTAMVTAQRKAGGLVLIAGVIQNLYKAPVHLERLSRLRFVAPAPIPLRLHKMPYSGHQVPVSGDIILYRRDTTRKSCLLKPFQADGGVRDATFEQLVEGVGIADEAIPRRLLTGVAMGPEREAAVFQTTQSAAGHAGTTLQLGQIQLLQTETVPGFGLHFLDGLSDARAFICVKKFFHSTSFLWAVDRLSIALWKNQWSKSPGWILVKITRPVLAKITRR